MEPGFPARLRRHREARHVELASIAEQTKIKLSLLEGLERGDVSRWPSGIFRRSYLRAYAKAIGLDVDEALREFLSLYPDPSDEAQSVAAMASGRDQTGGGAATRLKFLLGSAVSVLPMRRASDAPRTVAAAPAPDLFEGDAHESRRGSTGPAGQTAVAEERQEPQRIELPALAQLCTRLARATQASDVAGVLDAAVGVLDVVGLVLWLWDPQERVLRPSFVHGYPDEIVSQLPAVAGDSDTAIAASFRSADTCLVESAEWGTGAIVVPLMTSTGCGGVLALECRHGGERHEVRCVSATILAAQLSTLVAVVPLAHAASA